MGLVLVLVLALAPLTQAADSDNDGLEDDVEAALAEKYAPILYFKMGETFFPVAVEYHLERSNLNVSNPFGEDLVDSDPTATEIGALGDTNLSFYLDNRRGTIENDDIGKDYKAQRRTLGDTVYARVVENQGRTVIQYWFFYAFNQGALNIHEGDWETIMVVLEGNETATPVKTYYSQHVSGQQAAWSQVEKRGEHPKVYVAQGSHANYYRAYQGRMGLASDTVGDDGEVLEPGDYTLVLLGETGVGNHNASQDWLDYNGRWGDWGSIDAELRGSRGPPGPAYRANGSMWATPFVWGEELDSLDENILQVEWFLANFIKLFLVMAALSLLLKLLIIYRRHRKTGLGKLFSFFNLDGFNVKTLANLMALVAVVMAFYSIIQPWYGVYVEVEAGDYSTEGETQVFAVDGLEGLQINRLESQSGLVQLVGFPFPFAYLLGLGLVFMILATFGLQKTRKVGRKYLFSGLKLLIPVIIILAFIAQAASVAESAATELPAEAQELLQEVGDSPQGGEKTTSLGDYGQVKLRWGLEEGGKLLALAGAMLFGAGLLLLLRGGKMFKDREEKEQEKEQKERELEERERERQMEKERKRQEKEAKQAAKQAKKEMTK